MKKILIAFALIIFSTIQANAFQLNDYLQIKLTLIKYNKALSSKNIDQVKTFYDKDYKSADGFTLDELTQMLEKAYGAYGKMKQKTKINSITVFDNYALVQLSDTTKAALHPDKAKSKEKQGNLNSKSVYTLYLKQNNGFWKIYYDEILAESTSLKYGIAKKIPIKLNTPISIKNGENYDLSLKINKPDDVIALASITNEKIEFPTPDYKEKFRKLPPNGKLERIVKANCENKNEYAVASVGFTKISINEQASKAKIEILGIAYLMKRINHITTKETNAK